MINPYIGALISVAYFENPIDIDEIFVTNNPAVTFGFENYNTFQPAIGLLAGVTTNGSSFYAFAQIGYAHHHFPSHYATNGTERIDIGGSPEWAISRSFGLLLNVTLANGNKLYVKPHYSASRVDFNYFVTDENGDDLERFDTEMNYTRLVFTIGYVLDLE